MSRELQTEFDTILPGSVDRNDTVADSLMTLWTTENIEQMSTNSHMAYNMAHIRLSVTLTLFDCKSMSLLAT
jgi:hypothetical protein